MSSQKCKEVRLVCQVKEAIQCRIEAMYICYLLTKLFGDAIRYALFSTTVPIILELYFSLTYESRALLSDFSTYILTAEQDYEIEMNAY